jgi:hypothetical protein
MRPMNTGSSILARTLAAVALIGVAACGENEPAGPLGPEGPNDPGAPQTGSLALTTNTTGSHLDPDGYHVVIDGQGGTVVGVNATSSLTELSTGGHLIELKGVAGNCSVAGANPITVEIIAGETADASFSVSCQVPPSSIVVTISTSTAGSAFDEDQDGYELSIDGGGGGHVGTNDTITLVPVADGVHQLELAGVDSNCAVAGKNPQTVTVAEAASAEARFDILCEAVPRPITFTRNGALVVMEPDGSSQRTIQTGFHDVTGPAWSPDGTKIAFGPELWCWSDCDIWFLDAGSGNVTRVTQTGNNDGPAWSPDASRIAFTSWRDGHDEVYVIDADGTNLVRLTDGSNGSGSPAWSPDGTKIAFASSRDGDAEIYVMNADGTDPVRLTHAPGGDGDPAWSPDGSRIAFTAVRDGNYDVYVMAADGSDVVRLTSGSAIEWYPAWSSDGSRISYVRDNDIWVMNADGSGAINLTDDPAFEAWPHWRW